MVPSRCRIGISLHGFGVVAKGIFQFSLSVFHTPQSQQGVEVLRIELEGFLIILLGVLGLSGIFRQPGHGNKEPRTRLGLGAQRCGVRSLLDRFGESEQLTNFFQPVFYPRKEVKFLGGTCPSLDTSLSR